MTGLSDTSTLNETLFRYLFLIRHTEEEIARIYWSDKIQSPVHLSIGQEAAAVGVCQALRPTDVMFGTYRSHAAYLAKGGNVRRMMAELYGKVDGCARGKGGSMHLIAPEVKLMGTSAVVGTTISHAVGYAYAEKIRGNDTVVCTMFGDGAAEEGSFQESLNFASLKKTPTFFVCENNYYAVHTPLSKRQVVDNIHERARTFDIPSERIGDGDIFKIYEASERAVEHIKSGKGPYFIEVCTYRWREHVGPGEDFDAGYRSLDEASVWMDRDPIEVVGKMLDSGTRQRIENEVREVVEDAFEFAEQSPFPPAEELYASLFKDN